MNGASRQYDCAPSLVARASAISGPSAAPYVHRRSFGSKLSHLGNFTMNEGTREKLLKVALVAFGVIFCLVYPLGLVWPSGWVWHGGQGEYYFQMISGVYAILGAYLIAAARNPSEHRSLISFAIWSSVVHSGIMAAQSLYNEHERGHLIGDVPALLLVAAVLWFLSPAKQQRPGAAQ
jgi:hypothetical protein